jgi:glycosyltransferase involved in cell wall biosynthesis
VFAVLWSFFSEGQALVRSLAVVQVPPYPPMGGVALRNWQNICLLKQWGIVGVFSIYKGRREDTNLPGVELWHHYDIASPRRSPLAKVERRLQWLRPQGYPYADWLYTNEAAQQLENCLQQFQPDVVLFEEVWLYRYLPRVERYGCPLILDNHNIEGAKEAYRQKGQGFVDLWQHLRLTQLKAVERDFVKRAAQTWLCSAEDQRLLSQLYGSRNESWIIPNGVDVPFYAEAKSCQIARLKTPKQPYCLLFLAKFSYLPNAEAADILIQRVYPQLQQQYPDCQLLLVGRDPTPQMLQAVQEFPGIQVTGAVKDVRPYLALAEVLAVPLRQGGGTRLKILEAFAAGCAVVSTTKGAEGLAVQSGVQLLIRESPTDMAAGVAQLWENVEMRSDLIQAAWDLVND